MSAHFESAISRLRLTSERRARTTVIAILATAQNGTSGALAGGNHAGRRAAWATPQTGVSGHPPPPESRTFVPFSEVILNGMPPQSPTRRHYAGAISHNP